MAKKKTTVLTEEEILSLKALAGVANQLVNIIQSPKNNQDNYKQEKEQYIERAEETEDEVENNLPRPPKKQPIKRRNKLKGQYEKNKGRQARREVFEVKKRPNLFDKMKEKNSHKEDIKIDMALWQGRKPAPRAIRSTQIDIECDVCGKEFGVSPNEVKEDFDTGDLSYVCNDCIGVSVE